MVQVGVPVIPDVVSESGPTYPERVKVAAGSDAPKVFWCPGAFTSNCALVARTVRTTSVAGAQLLFPAWDAVSAQLAVPLIIVTVHPVVAVAIEQPPVATSEMGSPELAVGFTLNVEP